jgi:DNA repair protein SbcC/Rad50
MKLLQLQFENIHSLKGKHTIDFDNGVLKEAGLFAITGPTGSGKSTLLDVISLAIFGRIPRLNGKVSKSTVVDGGIMTRNTSDCFAEVIYESNGKTYKSHWSIAKNRNGNLNDYKMELSLRDGELYEILNSSRADVPDENANLIGLKYDQFIQAIVLSQGQFSKLIHASRKDRNYLLETLTGAQKYRQIGIAVFQRKRKIESDVNLKNEVIESVKLLSEEELTTKKEAYTVGKKEADTSRKFLNKLGAALQVKKELEADSKELLAQEEAQKTILKDISSKAALFEKLAKNDQFSIHREALSHFDLQSSKYKDTIRNTDAKKQELQQTNAALDTVLQEGAVFIGTAISKATFSKNLAAFTKEIRALFAEENKQQTLLLKQQKDVVTYLNQLKGNDVFTKDNFQILAKELRERIVDIRQKVNLQSDDTEIVRTAQLEVLENSSKELLALQQQQSEYLNKVELSKTAANDAVQKEKEIKVLETNTIALKQEIEEVTVAYTKLKAEREVQQKIANFEVHRENLEEGCPCPLCGSRDHPYINEGLHINKLEEDLLQSKEKELQSKRDLFSGNTALVKEKEAMRLSRLKDVNTFKNEAEELLLKNREALRSHAIADFRDTNALSAKIASVSENEKTLKIQIKALNYIEDLKAIEVLANEGILLKTDYENVVIQRKAKYLGDKTVFEHTCSDVTARFNKLEAASEGTEKDIQKLQEDLKKLQPLLEETTKLLEAIVAEANLSSIDALKALLLPDQEAQRIRAQKDVLSQKKLAIKTNIETLQKNIAKGKSEDTLSGTFLELTTVKNEKESALASLQKQLGALEQEFETDNENRDSYNRQLKVLKALQKDLNLWTKMDRLIGDAKGNKFSNFVQDMTLQQLVFYTNKRLSDLSDRYELVCPELDDNEDLKIRDCYMGNQLRSVKTLSGGETFVVSLAMAFALSDLAAKNVKISSLFIDEGFGTLDPEVLDQAIGILEKLQNEDDKSIGVISHIEAVKSRINTQIRLSKKGSGFSSLTIE